MTDDLSNRVAMLEYTVTGAGGLVETVALIRTDLADLRHQFLEHKEQTAAEFSALRGDIGELRGDVRTLEERLRTEMRGLGEDLRTEMRALNDETCRAMRVLHEDLVARIGLLQEGPAQGRKRRRSKGG
jgi:hypothetical protein